jgi:hypothetical protein
MIREIVHGILETEHMFRETVHIIRETVHMIRETVHILEETVHMIRETTLYIANLLNNKEGRTMHFRALYITSQSKF